MDSEPGPFVSAATAGDGPFRGFQSGQFVAKARLERILDASAPAPSLSASTVYLKPGKPSDFLASQGVAGTEWQDRLAGLDRGVLESDTGIVAFRCGGEALVVVPPFPVTANHLYDHWEPSPLLSILRADYTIGVVLLRLGRFSVAVYQGDRLLSSKTDARYVKGKHHAGGTSQLRFQRIREGQIRKIYDKTCEVVQVQFAPYARELDYVFLGGEKITLNGLLKVCPSLRRFSQITLGRRINVRDPKRDTLDELPAILRESRVYSFQWT